MKKKPIKEPKNSLVVELITQRLIAAIRAEADKINQEINDL